MIFRFPLFLLAAGFLYGQAQQTIQVGTFNIEWFPCKDDGELMREYGIELRNPPVGNSTDTEALFSFLKDIDIELLAVQEIVDAELFAEEAKKYLGQNYDFIYSQSGGSQKVGFLYDSSVLELLGDPRSYDEILLRSSSRLRPAFGAYFKSKSAGFDFSVVVVHLKSAPSGWDIREQQLEILEKILVEIALETIDNDVILLGDMNNVSPAGPNEFKSMIERLGYFWASGEITHKPTNFWQPRYSEEKIIASTIDHIFVSADAKVELIEKSADVAGMCSALKESFEAHEIPEYFHQISDHCPVFASFKIDKDDD
jgi:endonuclease/exonuclease/phosphatase family metal-dependent hydrolase